MSISEIFDGLIKQQIPALLTILEKGQQFAAEQSVDEADLLQARLADDMQPMLWQVQTTLELIARGANRLCHQELTSLSFEQNNLSDLINEVKLILSSLETMDREALNKSADTTYEIPVGPEATLSLTGQEYVLKFLLPNVYFHLTTTYALLRMKGLQLGKRDYMGPF
ncbi:MAG: hypothetical protein ACI9FR_000888 [Cryomorphaceae bacterium]|jgi:hypothetical protein